MSKKRSAIEVVDLLDKDGRVVGYATGTPEETASMSQAVWTSNSSPGAATALDALKAAMTARIQDARQSAESKGVLIGHDVFATDIASQVKYAAALIHTMRNPGFETSWKTANHGYVALKAADIEATCATVLAYIQLCYAWDQAMLAKVAAAGSVEELRSLDLDEGRPEGCLPYDTQAAKPIPARLKGAGGRPEVSKGECAGTRGRVSLEDRSTDTAGQVVVNASGLSVTGEMATVNFAVPYDTAPHVVLQATNANASTLKYQPFVTATTTGFTLNGTTALGTNKEFTWTYHVIQ
jgi:Domain of unknown function (DUF4376)